MIGDWRAIRNANGECVGLVYAPKTAWQKARELEKWRRRIGYYFRGRNPDCRWCGGERGCLMCPR